jgi:hypothetical protein
VSSLVKQARVDPSVLDVVRSRAKRGMRFGVGMAITGAILAALYVAVGESLPFVLEILVVVWAPLALCFGVITIGMAALQVSRVDRARRTLAAERLPVAQLRR